MILQPPIVHPVTYDLLIFDADGTLRSCTVPGQPCPNRPGEYGLMPHVRDTMALYDWRTVWVSIVSNQGGVGLGFLSEPTARFLLQETLAEATGQVIGPTQVWMCPHAPQAGCACRKPSPLLLEQAQMPMHSRGLLHGPDQVLYVGDQTSDREAAERAGITFCYAHVFFGWETTP